MVSGEMMKSCIVHVLLISAGITTAAARIIEWEYAEATTDYDYDSDTTTEVVTEPDQTTSNDITNITTTEAVIESGQNESSDISDIKTLLDSPFWPDRPGLCFGDNQQKLYDKLVTGLETTDLEDIVDILRNPPEMKYDAVKARLIAVHQRRLGEEPTGWLLGLVTGMELGDQKPSCLLKRMKTIAYYASVDTPTFDLQQMWMKKLARYLRIAIVIRETMSECTLEDLAAVADNLMVYNSLQNQLRYTQGHRKPSELLAFMQLLNTDIPNSFIQHALVKLYPSFVGTAIVIWESINAGSTLEDLADLADKTIWLKKEFDLQLGYFPDFLDVELTSDEVEHPRDFMARMRCLKGSMTSLHIWMYYLPEYMREAIIVKQSLNSRSTIRDMAELADKLQDLQ